MHGAFLFDVADRRRRHHQQARREPRTVPATRCMRNSSCGDLMRDRRRWGRSTAGDAVDLSFDDAAVVLDGGPTAIAA